MKFGLYNHTAVTLTAVGFEVVLVILLGGPEGFQGFNPGNRQRLVYTGVYQSLKGSFGRLFLGFVVVKNNGTVLGADVVSLAVESGGIVGVPEHFQDGCEGDCCCIKAHFHNFGMPGFSGGYLSVIRIFDSASGISRACGYNARYSLVNSFNTPEASAAQNDTFSVVRQF